MFRRTTAFLVIFMAVSLPLRGAQGVRRAPPADAIVRDALKKAATDHKTVLIEFGASWCSWCRAFDAFVHAKETSAIIAANYIVVNLVVQERQDKKELENPGGDVLMNGFGGAEAGLPFYVFLDNAGKQIANSNVMPDGSNVGFPGTPQEVNVFMGLFNKTAAHANDADLMKIRNYLNAHLVP